MMDMPLPEPDKVETHGHEGWCFGSDGAKKISDHTYNIRWYSVSTVRARDAQWRAIVAAEVAKERERIRAAIMAKHEAANGQHNLYHCLAVELFGDEAIRAAAPPQCTSAPSEPQ